MTTTHNPSLHNLKHHFNQLCFKWNVRSFCRAEDGASVVLPLYERVRSPRRVDLSGCGWDVVEWERAGLSQRWVLNTDTVWMGREEGGHQRGKRGRDYLDCWEAEMKEWMERRSCLTSDVLIILTHLQIVLNTALVLKVLLPLLAPTHTEDLKG